MSPIRMRVMLLVPLLLVSVGLTTASLLVVRSRIERQMSETLASDVTHSVATFQNLQHQRQEMLAREGALLADLPSLKALMTTHDRRTIEDGGQEFFKVSGADLFALTTSEGKVLALYEGSGGLENANRYSPEDLVRSRRTALESSLQLENNPRFVVMDGRLFEFTFKPLYFGNRANGQILGYVIIGYSVDQSLAHEVSEAAAAEATFLAHGIVVASTLDSTQEIRLSATSQELLRSPMRVVELWLGPEHFSAVAVQLAPGNSDDIQLVVLKSFRQQDELSRRLNHLFLGLGAAALLVGVLLSLSITRTVTRPIEALVSGVRALGTGDYNYRLPQTGAREVHELSSAFGRMRDEIRRTQQKLIESERLATIGRMASSVSHDLRHYLAAVYANAEFLASAVDEEEKTELFGEIRLAVNGMTDLIESLLMFSRTGNALQLTQESVLLLVEKAVALVGTHPEAATVRINVEAKNGDSFDAWVDAKKMQRAIFNLVLNACQAANRGGLPQGVVTITLGQAGEQLYIRVADNGSGVAMAIRGNLFEPFVSEGKENGVGLGLTLAHRVAEEHGGAVALVKSDPGETVFLLSLNKRAPGIPQSSVSSRVASSAGASKG
ncbi:MAG TPA: ATP-binding protein [Acidisarcina sp.]|nr:ATP-binding protein [Acidisarcina sp.]